MASKDVWQEKSDLQLAIAARELDSYKELSKQAILLEISKRGLERVFFKTIASFQSDSSLISDRYRIIFEHIESNKKSQPTIERVEQSILKSKKSCPHCVQPMAACTTPVLITAPSGYEEINSLQGIKGSWNCLKCDYSEVIESLKMFVLNPDLRGIQNASSCQMCATKLVSFEEAVNLSDGFFHLPLHRLEQTDDMPQFAWGDGCTKCVTCDKCDRSFQGEDIFILKSTVLSSSYNPSRGQKGEIMLLQWKYYHPRCLK